jgi:hypothetical protein
MSTSAGRETIPFIRFRPSIVSLGDALALKIRLSELRRSECSLALFPHAVSNLSNSEPDRRLVFVAPLAGR